MSHSASQKQGDAADPPLSLALTVKVTFSRIALLFQIGGNEKRRVDGEALVKLPGGLAMIRLGVYLAGSFTDNC
jgi:hypothetical protein